METAGIKDNTLHSKVSDMTRRLRGIERRTVEITASICGHAPESSNSVKPIEEHLHEKIDAMSAVINDIESELTRLQSAVGSNAVLGQAKAVSY